MAAGAKDWEVYQGDTFRKSFTWYDKNKKEIDLTDFSARMQLRADPSSDAVADLTTENDGITLGGVDGSVELYISAEDMAEIDAGSYKYDLEMIDASGDVRKILKGKIKVIAEITKDS